jgi:hypothetical protein
MEQPRIEEKPDVHNKKGVFKYFKGELEDAMKSWKHAVTMNEELVDAIFNQQIC